jgi:uncharacterized membrane protein
MHGSISFRVDEGRDPDGAALRSMMEAHFARERWRALGQLLAYALVPLAGLVWAAAFSPGLLPRWAVRLGKVGWASGAFGLIIALVMRSLAGRTLRRLSVDAQGSPSRSSPHEPD